MNIPGGDAMELNPPEKDGYYALLLAIIKGYSASKALSYIKNGQSRA